MISSVLGCCARITSKVLAVWRGRLKATKTTGVLRAINQFLVILV